MMLSSGVSNSEWNGQVSKADLQNWMYVCHSNEIFLPSIRTSTRLSDYYKPKPWPSSLDDVSTSTLVACPPFRPSTMPTPAPLIRIKPTVSSPTTSCLLQLLRIDPVPFAESAYHRSNPVGAHGDREDSAQPRHVGFEDGWDLQIRESHADLRRAYAQDGGRIDLWETFGQLLDHLVVEPALCCGDEEGSADGCEDLETRLVVDSLRQMVLLTVDDGRNLRHVFRRCVDLGIGDRNLERPPDCEPNDNLVSHPLADRSLSVHGVHQPASDSRQCAAEQPENGYDAELH